MKFVNATTVFAFLLSSTVLSAAQPVPAMRTQERSVHPVEGPHGASSDGTLSLRSLDSDVLAARANVSSLAKRGIFGSLWKMFNKNKIGMLIGGGIVALFDKMKSPDPSSAPPPAPPSAPASAVPSGYESAPPSTRSMMVDSDPSTMFSSRSLSSDLKAAHSVQEPHPALVSVNKDFHPALILLNRAEVPQTRSLQDEHPGRIVLSSEKLSALQQVHPRNVGSGSEHQQLTQRSWWKTSTTQPSNARNVEDLLTRHPSDSADLLQRRGELPSGAHPQARNLLVEASWALMAGQIIGNVFKKGTLF
ncbi:unnamed protein product [Tilletia controversa]|nr:unnamed protein product [Tilletia caries]CAD6896467.1 unnamed protein product [Tilletia controversa]CAD6913693.1 unnamed protein product [Tilletia laevis]CAD7059937.1 unnamed protein product [Tilletia caries]